MAAVAESTSIRASMPRDLETNLRSSAATCLTLKPAPMPQYRYCYGDCDCNSLLPLPSAMLLLFRVGTGCDPYASCRTFSSCSGTWSPDTKMRARVHTRVHAVHACGHSSKTVDTFYIVGTFFPCDVSTSVNETRILTIPSKESI